MAFCVATMHEYRSWSDLIMPGTLGVMESGVVSQFISIETGESITIQSLVDLSSCLVTIVPPRLSGTGLVPPDFLPPLDVWIRPTSTRQPIQSLLLRRQHNNIFPRTLPKRHHIPAHHLHIPPPLHSLPIHPRPIGAIQVNHIWLDPSHLIPILVLLLHMPELQHRVLLAAARVLGREIRDGALAPEEPAAARAEGNGFEQVWAFEDVEAPGGGGGGEARFGGFVVF